MRSKDQILLEKLYDKISTISESNSLNCSEEQGFCDQGIYHVEKAKMYWQARWDKDIPPIGFSVPKWSGPGITRQLEETVEKRRQKYNPDAVSRLNCIFVCPVLNNGWCSCNNKYKPDEEKKRLCEVEVTGKIYIGDIDLYSSIIGMYKQGDRRDVDVMEDYIERYWTNGNRAYSPEALVDGKVIVTGYACDNKKDNEI